MEHLKQVAEINQCTTVAEVKAVLAQASGLSVRDYDLVQWHGAFKISDLESIALPHEQPYPAHIDFYTA